MNSTMSDLINRMAAFFVGLTDNIGKAGFGSVPLTIVTFLFALAAIVNLFMSLRKWLIDHNTSFATGIVEWMQFGAKHAMVWFFILGSPLLTQVVTGGIIAMLKPLPTSIATSAGALADAQLNAVTVIWYAQSAIQHDLAVSNPLLFDGAQDLNGQETDAKMVDLTLAQMKKQAQVSIAEMQAQSKALLASSNPADQQRGKLLKSQAAKAASDLSRGIDGAAGNLQEAQGNAKDQNDGTWQYQLLAAQRSFKAGLTFGLSELVLLLKRLIAGGYGFIAILFPLIMSVMAAFKLLTTLMEVFSYLASYIIVTKLACSFAAVVMPVALLGFLTQEWKQYSHRAISFFLQAASGAITLVAGVKIAVVGMTSLAGFASSAGTSVFTAIAIANPDIGGKVIGGFMAGIGLFLVAVAAQFFSSIVQKSPQAGIGVMSGTFHP